MLTALLGGGLIGLGATVLWFATRRVAGVTGLVEDALRGQGSRRWVSLAFLVGLLTAGAAIPQGASRVAMSPGSLAVLAVAGLLAGFGARLGGGCTSGHGVCGISRLSVRSIVATLTFMATGVATVFVTRHLVPWIGGVR